MEQDRALDIQRWQEAKKKMEAYKPSLEQEEFKLICELHAKYKNHKYYDINFCTCNKNQIKQWIREVDECLQ